MTVPTFRYRALGTQGDIVLGEMDGDSEAVVIGRLQSLGQMPLAVNPANTSPMTQIRNRLIGITAPAPRIPIKDLAAITRQLATLLQAGLALDRAFDIIIGMVTRDRDRRVLQSVRERLRAGASLSSAISGQRRSFPPVYVSLIQAGEAGGTLGTTLTRLADYLLKSHLLSEKIKSAMVYPIVLLAVAGISITLVLTIVLPEFEPFFVEAGAALPWSTRYLMAVGDFVRSYWWLIAAALFCALVAWRHIMTIPRFRLRWHSVTLSLPLIGDLVTKSETARFSRTLGSLAESGIPIPTALSIVGPSIGNSALTSAIKHVSTELKQGKGLAGPLERTKLFPDLCIQFVRVGEEAGCLDDMLLKQADVFDQEVQRTVERLLAILVPSITVFLGMVIGGIIASILVAIISLNDLAQ